MRAASRTFNLPYSPPSHPPLPSYLIAQLCEYIMANSTKVSLLVCTFQTLLKFLNWIPLGYIFETALVKNLVYKFLPHQVGAILAQFCAIPRNSAQLF